MSGKMLHSLIVPDHLHLDGKLIRESKMLHQFLLSLQVQFSNNTGIVVTISLSDIMIISIIAIITFMICIL